MCIGKNLGRLDRSSLRVVCEQPASSSAARVRGVQQIPENRAQQGAPREREQREPAHARGRRAENQPPQPQRRRVSLHRGPQRHLHPSHGREQRKDQHDSHHKIQERRNQRLPRS